MHHLTQELLKHLGKNINVEPHEPSDNAGSDRIWIIQYDDGGMSEGEYLSLEPIAPNSSEWYVAHNAADICGGHPTYWSTVGSCESLLPQLVSLFLDRKAKLTRNVN